MIQSSRIAVFVSPTGCDGSAGFEIGDDWTILAGGYTCGVACQLETGAGLTGAFTGSIAGATGAGAGLVGPSTAGAGCVSTVATGAVGLGVVESVSDAVAGTGAETCKA